MTGIQYYFKFLRLLSFVSEGNRWQSININAAHPDTDQYRSIYSRHAVDVMNYGEP